MYLPESFSIPVQYPVSRTVSLESKLDIHQKSAAIDMDEILIFFAFYIQVSGNWRSVSGDRHSYPEYGGDMRAAAYSGLLDTPCSHLKAQECVFRSTKGP